MMKDEKTERELVKHFLRQWTTLRHEDRTDPIIWLRLKFSCSEREAQALFDRAGGEAIITEKP